MATQSVHRRLLGLGPAALGLVAALAAATTLHLPEAQAADDVDLLRKQGGQPYVFFIVDTSGSMVLDEDNAWVPLNGDDPSSKIFQVKKALYEVMSSVDNVHYGLAGFNQDRLAVTAKHWIYRADTDGGQLSGPVYPTAAGEAWTFGRHINTTGVAGTCDAPLSVAGDLARINRFARLGLAGLETTTLWVTDGGTDYRVRISLSPDSPGNLGSPDILVRVAIREVLKCDPVEVAIQEETVDVPFSRVSDFLMVEANPADVDTVNCTGDETMTGLWNHSDVFADGTCGSGSDAPFTGRGWEGNTDSGDRVGHEDDLDECCVDVNNPGVCVDNPDASHVCYNLHFPTQLHPDFNELDKGDQIPLSWEVAYHDEFLKRLNPRHPADPDFGMASYFEDRPDAVSGLFQLKDEAERPLMAFGNSPLGRAVNDFRCWYLGSGSNKCKGPSFDPGWEELFRENDLEYGCRVPYLIIISDGEDNSRGENPAADTANLWSKAGIRTFAFTFERTSQLQRMVQNGKGDLILVEDGDDLAQKLREVIGFIQEESRTFASAAVPSVQASVEDKIYLTNFTPLDGAGTWDGHAHSFLKPLPLDPITARPDTTHSNHLWDAGQVMLSQAPDPVAGDTSSVDLQLGGGLNERRVFYALDPEPGDPALGPWPSNRRLFDRTTDQLDEEEPIEPVEPDLWDGLGLTYDPDDETSVRDTRRRAHSIIEATLIEKTYTSEETGTIQYILGDIFHSDPLILGGPVNTEYFVDDAEETFDGDGSELGTGYREFFLKHENRRKVLLAGANDGMLHAWDAGKPRVEEFVDDSGIRRREVLFGNGTGRELFSYVPRSVLTTVKNLAESPAAHRWSVDGSIAAADVFIDPLHQGTPDPAEREWRTVLIGGLREGGSAYYALDVTHPDHLGTDTVGPTEDPSQQREVTIATDQAVVPDCHASAGGSCDPNLPYPAPLWEFTDRIWDSVAREWVVLDEDQNQLPDLGETWSSPDIGRIRVVEDDEVVNKYVAVFGGGLDPNKAGSRGNFLYIVDFETGEVLYKREVEGSVPSDPAAVDTNQDGFLDRVYFGTTAGFMYRVDLVDPEAPDELSRHPELVDTLVTGMNGTTYTRQRFDAGSDPSDPLWAPVQIFSTEGRPIYYPPTVLFVAKLGEFALGFGTGDRDALGFKSDLTGRFYTFVDDSADAAVEPQLPLTESSFEQVDLTEGENPDLLTVGDPGERGWYMVLDQEERLISAPFGLVGVTFFATFDPQVVNETCEVGPGCNENPQCSLSGNSRIYVVETTSANPFLETVDGNPTRFQEVSGFVTEPFTEQGVSKDAAAQDDETPDADDLTDRERDVMESLRNLFPRNCKFGNHRIDIKMIAADTRLERIAAVPICIIEKNWKEVTD